MSQQPVILSLALIVNNEARCLERCLKSITHVVDETVVVDTGSTDGTLGIAQSLGAKVSTFQWSNDFAAARNFALDQTRGTWILVLDADEHASPGLAGEIRAFIGGTPAVGRLKILSDFRRNNQLLRSQSFVSRLFPRGARFEGRIHEQVVSALPRVNLKGELWHDGYLEQGKSDRNIKLLLEELRENPNDSYLLFQLALEYTSTDRPNQACGYLAQAFAQSGLKEPYAPNLVVDYLYTLTQLKKHETGLEVIAKSATQVDDFPDFHLACGLFYMDLVKSNPAKYLSYLPRIEESFRHCLALGETSKYKSVEGSGTFLAHYNLGLLYHVFDNPHGARDCFQEAAKLGFEPARQMLSQLPRA
jgi:glycosyltransferase involved in cell wall biosynthesis